MKSQVLAITVGWNCREAIARGIAALLEQTAMPPPDILVIDNASTDGLGEFISAHHPLVELLRLETNTGGAGGFAIGMELAAKRGYKSAWLLDGDARASGTALQELIREAEVHPHAGAIASLIARDDGSGLIQECGGKLSFWSGRPVFLDAGKPLAAVGAATEVDYGAACSLLISCAAIREVGSFDKSLFVFFDDIEWCLRAKRLGWRIRTAPKSVAFHPWHSAKPPQPWRLYYGARNQIRVLARNRPQPFKIVLEIVWIAWALRWSKRWRSVGEIDLAEALETGVQDALKNTSRIPNSKVQSRRLPGKKSLWMTTRSLIEAVILASRAHG